MWTHGRPECVRVWMVKLQIYAHMYTHTHTCHGAGHSQDFCQARTGVRDLIVHSGSIDVRTPSPVCLDTGRGGCGCSHCPLPPSPV